MCAAAADKKGLKRVCADCGIRFYDFNKRPIICPNCETEFTGIEKAKPRRGRATVEQDDIKNNKAPKSPVKDDDDEIESDDVISLDDLDDDSGLNDDEDDDAIGPDLDLDDDSIDDLDVDLDDGGPDDIEEDDEEDDKD